MEGDDGELGFEHCANSSNDAPLNIYQAHHPIEFDLNKTTAYGIILRFILSGYKGVLPRLVFPCYDWIFAVT